MKRLLLSLALIAALTTATFAATLTTKTLEAADAGDIASHSLPSGDDGVVKVVPAGADTIGGTTTARYIKGGEFLTLVGTSGTNWEIVSTNNPILMREVVDAFTVTAAVTLGDTLTVDGASTLTGNVTVSGTLGVAEAVDFAKGIKAGTSNVAITTAAGKLDGEQLDTDTVDDDSIDFDDTPQSETADAVSLNDFGALYGAGGTSLADPADGALVSTTVTVTGATVGDWCMCSPSTFTGLVVTEGVYFCLVSANDTVTVTYQDSLANAAHADPDGAGTWSAVVFKN